ncbi:ComEC/Rec2 family competence protein [Pelagibacterium limicola]|uniref:ComEC/Rec2 family competence protein n=1 Tax=Pelagibacterium limicola TaxID=2791022 RepID=UPI0018AF7D05|nr:ComEC/Rec2 family competence protein [Pelagibacterium limicola]
MTEGAAPRRIAFGRKVPPDGHRWLPALASRVQYLASAFWTATNDAAGQRRTFNLIPFAIVAGIVAFRLLPFEPDLFVLACGAGIAVAAIYFVRRTHWAVMGLAALVGFNALPFHGAVFGTPMLAAPKYGQYTMRIDAVIFDDGEAQRWLVSGIDAEDPRDDPGVRRARVAVPGNLAVQPGDRVHARVRFYPIPAPVAPGSYDAQFTGYFDGIGAYGAVLDTSGIIASGEGELFRFTERLRRAIAERILTVLDPDNAGIAIALITGDQSRLSEDDRTLMASVGLAHVLAISGLHLTLVAGTAFFALRAALSLSWQAAQQLPVKRIAALGGISVAVAYLVISGMGIAAIRATIMLTLIFAAIVFGRQALTMRNVALAGLIIALTDPASIFRASFQLSFAAVIALIAAYEMARENRERRAQQGNAVLRLFLDIAMTSIIAGLATLAFTAYHFQQTAPFGLLGNLLAMPIVTFIVMPSALFATLLIPVGLDEPCFRVMGLGIQAMLWCAQMVRAFSGGFDPSPLLAPSALIVCFAALGWLGFYRTRIRLLGPLVAVPVIFLFCAEQAPDVLVADSTQAVAVRHDGQLALVAGRVGTFAVNVWSERYMETILPSHEQTGCDALGCIIDTSLGFALALAKDPAAFAEDCDLADLVITRMPAPAGCSQSATVIDAASLERYGTHALYWNESAHQFAVKTSISDPARHWRIRYSDATHQ